MEKAVIPMTARHVREGIKKGLCVQDYCELYGMDAEEFSRQIKILFKHEADDIFSQVVKSGKKRKRARHRSRRPVDVERTMSFLVKPGPPAEPTPEERIDTLKQEEKVQSDLLMGLEKSYWDKLRQHKENLAAVRKIGQDIEALEQEFAQKTTEYKDLVAKDDNLVAEISQLSVDCRDKKARLQDLRQEILSLQTVCLGIYDDGQIKIEDGPEIALDDTRKEEMFSRLIQRDECQNLRMRDIKTLARLMAITDGLNIKKEYIFENDELEQAFRTFDKMRQGNSETEHSNS